MIQVPGAECSSLFIDLDNYDLDVGFLDLIEPSTLRLIATPAKTKPQGGFLANIDIFFGISPICLEYNLSIQHFFVLLVLLFAKVPIDNFSRKGRSRPLTKLQYTIWSIGLDTIEGLVFSHQAVVGMRNIQVDFDLKIPH